MSSTPKGTMMAKGTCDTCQFWERQISSGLCRRLPPAPMQGGHANWSFTRPEDWCGEFKAVTVETEEPAPEPITQAREMPS